MHIYVTVTFNFGTTCHDRLCFFTIRGRFEDLLARVRQLSDLEGRGSMVMAAQARDFTSFHGKTIGKPWEMVV